MSVFPWEFVISGLVRQLCKSLQPMRGQVDPGDSWLYSLPEVSSMKYCCLRVFRKEYFRLVNK